MTEHSAASEHRRPDRFIPTEVPPLPDPGPEGIADTSSIFSQFRTRLSRKRTGLSEHRTDLSEYRTDLSDRRTELSKRRTGMSIQRTRMSADRTLMSEIRTSLSMIGFGFTLYQVFEKLAKAGTLKGDSAPMNFGLALILLGMLILIGGIWRHVQFATELRHRRSLLMADDLIHGESRYPVSIPLIVAIGLFGVGLLAALSIITGLSLFG